MAKIFQIACDQDNSKYFDMVREVVTDKWISQQFKTLYHKNQFKEQGVLLGLVHPLICYYLNIKQSVRKASILKQKQILTGVGYHRVADLGRCLYELKDICNIEKLRSRLQDSSQFQDVCWELNVAMVLKYSGFDVTFVKENSVKSYDLLVKINDVNLPIECKNKKADHQDHNTIMSICSAVSKSVLEQLDKQTSRSNIRITLLDVDSLSQAKLIKSKIKELLENDLKEIKTEKFEIQDVPEYESLPTSLIIKEYNEEAAYCSAECKLHRAYSKIPVSEQNYKNRVFFRFTPPEQSDFRVITLLEKANRQFKENRTTGCVFLNVPYGGFYDVCGEVKEILKRTYSSIGAVKVISLKTDFSPIHGVVTGRKELLIVNDKCVSPLGVGIVEQLSQNLMFNIYK